MPSFNEKVFFHSKSLLLFVSSIFFLLSTRCYCYIFFWGNRKSTAFDNNNGIHKFKYKALFQYSILKTVTIINLYIAYTYIMHNNHNQLYNAVSHTYTMKKKSVQTIKITNIFSLFFRFFVFWLLDIPFMMIFLQWMLLNRVCCVCMSVYLCMSNTLKKNIIFHFKFYL